MATKKHVYEVAEDDGATGGSRLIEATNRSTALHHVIDGRYKVTLASARRVADLHKAGVTIEETDAATATDATTETETA